MRTARLVIYEGTPQAIASTIAQSMSEGVHQTPHGTTTIIMLPEMFVAALEIMGVSVVQAVADKHEGKFASEMKATDAGINQNQALPNPNLMKKGR